MQRPSEMTMGTILLVLGAFAGFCFGRFTASLSPSSNVQIQWDIGNTVVGAATALVAVTSIWIALGNRKRDSGQKISDYRMKWSEDLRQDTASYIKFHQNVMLSRRKSGTVPVDDRDRLLELSEIRARLKMMIRKDTDDEYEKIFLSLISQDVENDEEKAKKQRLEIIDASREIQKTAWQLVKSEIEDTNLKGT